MANLSAGESKRGSHRLMTAMKCDRRYMARYIEMLDEATPGEPLALGSLFHLGAMHYYLAQRVGGPPEGFSLLDPIDAMRSAPARIVWAFDRAARVWARYVPWAKRNDRWEVLDVEREFTVRLAGQEVTARIDLCAYEEGAVRFVDHKTAGGVLKNLYLDYEMSPQLALHEVIGEALCQEVYGRPFGGVWINAVSTRDGAGPVAWREPIRIEPLWRDAAIRALTQASNHAAALEARVKLGALGFWDLDANPTACRGRYGWCTFRDLCLRGPSAIREYVRVGDVVTALGEGAGE